MYGKEWMDEGKFAVNLTIDDLLHGPGVLPPKLRELLLKDNEIGGREMFRELLGQQEEETIFAFCEKIRWQAWSISQQDVDAALSALAALGDQAEAALFEIVVLVAHGVALAILNRGLAALGESRYAIAARRQAQPQAWRPGRWGVVPERRMRLASLHRSTFWISLMFRLQAKIVSMVYGQIPIPHVLISMGHRIHFWGLESMNAFQFWMCHRQSFWKRVEREMMAGCLSKANHCHF